MIYDELLRSGRIREEKVSRLSVRQALERAERDLQVAARLIAEDLDWAFAISYNAVLQASRAYMFAQGYRPASAEGHKNTFAFMRIALGKEHEELITYFDRMRVKRNQATYNVAGLITETETQNLLEKARDFVAWIHNKLAQYIE